MLKQVKKIFFFYLLICGGDQSVSLNQSWPEIEEQQAFPAFSILSEVGTVIQIYWRGCTEVEYYWYSPRFVVIENASKEG